MVIIAKTFINIFAHKHPASKAALNSWYQIVKEVDWGNFNDVRNTFGSVDAVGNDRYVFNIKGNDYRLIAMIFSTSVPCISGLSVHMLNTTS